jgi:Domain of unknown function (DUF4832)/Domain of unknown function (DUF4874)/FG-GAP-like repeat
LNKLSTSCLTARILGTAFAVLLSFAAIAQAPVTVTYSSSADNFANPERGFYVQRFPVAPASQLYPIDVANLQSARANGMAVVRAYFLLDTFKTGPISATVLTQINDNFAKVRAAGMKIVPRFAYNFPTGDYLTAQDAPVAIVLQHLTQLEPLLRNNADVIAFVEAGLIGAWGEWHTSSNGLIGTPGDERALNANTRAIVDKLMSVLPPDRAIAVRYPAAKMQLFASQPLSATEAFTNTTKARIGHHNDCFLAGTTDRGTYADAATPRETERTYHAADSLYTPQGGETCGVDDSSAYSSCTNALAQLARYHYSVLNIDYDPTVLGLWSSGGCMAEIQKRLGYRFRLIDSTAATEVAAGKTLTLTLRVTNEGFANLYNPRRLEVVLRPRAGGNVIRISTNEDVRRWLPGETKAITLQVPIAASTVLGAYDVLLNLPDAAAAIASRPEYAIRFANAGVWETATGFNALNREVRVVAATTLAGGASNIIYRDAGTGAVSMLTMNGTVASASNVILAAGEGWNVSHVADMDGDGKPDLIARNNDGRVGVMLMNGTSVTSFSTLLNAGSGWAVTQAADLSGDGKADLVIRHSDGRIALLFMNGAGIANAAQLTNAGSPYTPTHAADLNGDGRADLVLKHTDGSAALLLMDGATVIGASILLNAGGPWSVSHVADLNGDRKADVIVKNADGSAALLLMDGTTVTSAAYLLSPGSAYAVTHTGDFNGDGSADILLRSTDGAVVVLQMNGTAVSAATFLLLAGTPYSVAQVADYNSDGKSDILLRNADGSATVILMNGGTVTAAGSAWGAGLRQVVP